MSESVQLVEARAICYAWERRCDALAAKLARAEGLLRELFALVQGECPSVLSEDSGGCERLWSDIDAYFAEQEPRT